MKKGMLVNVLRAKNYNCTNGPSAGYDTLLLVGPGVPEIFEESAHRPTYTLVKQEFGAGEPYLHIQPIEGNGYMMGGNFAWTADSRFPNAYPLPIHDRTEPNYYGID